MNIKRVLLVEDSKTIGTAITGKLSQKGFECLWCQTFKEAKDILRGDRDFVSAILDLSLPDALNGEIVDLVISHKISSIVLSGNFNDDVYEQMVAKNIVDFVVKNRQEDLDYTVKMVEQIASYTHLKALVVDDSKLSREMLKMQLRTMHFQVLEAKDGTEALNILKFNPDITLVITDYHMPNMDGFELTLEIRKRYSKEQMVIIAVTAHGSYEITAKFLKYGANSYIAKPYTKEEFNYTVHNTMEVFEIKRKNASMWNLLNKNVVYSTTDTEGYITFVSHAFEVLSGYTKEELIGKKHSLLKHPENNPALFTHLWQTITNGEKWSGEVHNRTKNGGDYWSKIEIEPLKNHVDRIIGYIAIRFDITDKILKEKNQELLLQQSRFTVMGKTINTIAHHWRHPLTHLSLILQNAQDEWEDHERSIDPETLHEMFRRSGEIIQELSHTIDNFRDFFSHSNQQMRASMKKVIEECIRLVVHEALHEKVQFIIDCHDDLMIKTYLNELKQVILHLITNAKEAIDRTNRENGIIEIRVAVVSGTLSISVHDNGGGISPTVLHNVFEPYFSSKSHSYGKGIGLYMAKMLVEKSIGGGLHLENTDEGLKATIVLKEF